MAYIPTLIDFEGSDADNLPSAGSKINANLNDIASVLSYGEMAQSLVPNGRLFVPPSFVETGGAGEFQINAANKAIAFKYTPECDHTMGWAGVYCVTCTAAGNINYMVWGHDATNDRPDPNVATICGPEYVNSTGWRMEDMATNVYQFQRGKTVWVGVKFKDTGNQTFAYRRWNTNPRSMFPDSMQKCLSTDDNWSTSSAVTQDSKPAMLCFMMPYGDYPITTTGLGYGRYNGKHIYLPGVGVREIPEASVTLATEALTADTMYYIYIYDNSGTLTLEASTTVPITSEGVLVKTGATTRRYLGMIFPKTLIPGQEGPIDVMDSRLVMNHYNKVPKGFGKEAPFSAATSKTVSNSWLAWNENTDYKFEGIFDGLMPITIQGTVHSYGMNQGHTVAGIQMDATTGKMAYGMNSGNFENDAANGSGASSSFNVLIRPSPGYHYFLPMYYERAGDGTRTAIFYTNSDTEERSAVNGTIFC